MDIDLEDVWFRYINTEDFVLKGVNLQLPKPGIYVVTGPNGSGKTTLLMVMAGLLKPQRGFVKVDGVDLYSKDGSKLRKYIALLFQNPEAMIFNPTVYDEITYTIKQLNKNANYIEDRVKYWLEYFELDKGMLSRSPFTLSYGYKKLVLLISMFIYNPKILLLDEPHSGLSMKYVKKLIEVLQRHRDSGGIAVIASHNLKPYIGIANKLVFIRNGVVRKLIDIG